MNGNTFVIWALVGWLGVPALLGLGTAQEKLVNVSQRQIASSDSDVLTADPVPESVVTPLDQTVAFNPGQTENQQTNPLAGIPPVGEDLAGVSMAQEGAGNLSEASLPQDYTVQPEDVLQITVYQEPDLTTQARITRAGKIQFPLLGEIDVQGYTVKQIQEKVTKLLLADYLVDPQVNVFIETYHSRNVFVTGAVVNPGSYPLPTEKPTTVMEAIVMAGGFTKDAAPNKTRIIRIKDGHEKTMNVRADDIIKKGDKSKDVEVYQDDVIFVGESFF